MHRTWVHGKFVTQPQHVAKLVKEHGFQLGEPGAPDALRVYVDVVEVIAVGEESFGNQGRPCGIVATMLSASPMVQDVGSL